MKTIRDLVLPFSRCYVGGLECIVLRWTAAISGPRHSKPAVLVPNSRKSSAKYKSLTMVPANPRWNVASRRISHSSDLAWSWKSPNISTDCPANVRRTNGRERTEPKGTVLSFFSPDFDYHILHACLSFWRLSTVRLLI